MNLKIRNLSQQIMSFLGHLHRDPGDALRRIHGYFKKPLFVFQMGKVGSRTHVDTLQSHYYVRHMHTSSDFKRIYDKLCESSPNLVSKKLEIVTIIREPIGRKISTFFQNLIDSPYSFSFKSRKDVLDAGIDELLKRFSEWDDGINEASEWFDRHFEPVTGICVYNHKFNAERGWDIIRGERWDVLLLRFQDIGNNHLDALNHFLLGQNIAKHQIKQLRPQNISTEKWYGDLMKQFRERVIFNADELEFAYGSKYMRHFHTPLEIEKIRAKWIPQ